MEKKRTQRIIGILVVLALVIIVMPLFFGKSDFPSHEASNLKSPAFPEEQTNVASANQQNNGTDVNANQAVEPSTIAEIKQPDSGEANTMQPSQASAPAAAQSSNPAMLNAAPPTQPSADSTTMPTTAAAPSTTSSLEPADQMAQTNSPAIPTPDANTIVITQSPVEKIATTNSDSNTGQTPPAIITDQQPAAPALTASSTELSRPTDTQKIDNQPAKPVKAKTAVMRMKHTKTKLVKTPVTASSKDNNLKTPGWAIQMGNFTVKSNATNLTNKLRAAGYKAFTREIKSSTGHNSTRVYIGPELKQASAVKLSNKVQQDMKMQGIVIPFKPMSL
ncbi:MAG: SPOR domain-containing protein [Gammaproteobacteria bacterium]